ncbi:MAG TPA: acyl carrier protein [Thermodesulfobacteriota bacterium]|nr:acyl carrier protein [Thermodesulfobacteriota bacterium]
MEERIKEMMVRRFPGVGSNLGYTDLLRTKGFTSLMFVELILSLEEEFTIEILDEEIGPGRFSTVERIAEYVRCKLEGRPIPVLAGCPGCKGERSGDESSVRDT